MSCESPPAARRRYLGSGDWISGDCGSLSVMRRESVSVKYGGNILLRVELVLLESFNELSRETESAQAEAALGTTADIVHQCNCPLVHLLLVEKLVLDHVHVDKVAHVGAGVPPDAVRVNVDLSHHSDHFGLVGNI